MPQLAHLHQELGDRIEPPEGKRNSAGHRIPSDAAPWRPQREHDSPTRVGHHHRLACQRDKRPRRAADQMRHHSDDARSDRGGRRQPDRCRFVLPAHARSQGLRQRPDGLHAEPGAEAAELC